MAKPHIDLSYIDGDYYHEAFYSLKPNSGTKFNRSTFIGDVRPYFDKSHVPVGTERDVKGKLSQKAKSRLKTAVNWMFELADEKSFFHATKKDNEGEPLKVLYKVAFVTLTLPTKQMHSDNEILELAFQPFLKKITNRYGKKIKVEGMKSLKHQLNYVWKAELQKDGNIHFHILIDTFIDWREIRSIWNEMLNGLGYIDAYRKKMQAWHEGGFRIRTDLLQPRKNEKHNTTAVWTQEAQLAAFYRGIEENWSNPNTTDVHSVQQVGNIAAYVCKYMSKGEGFTQEESDEYDRLKLIENALEKHIHEGGDFLLLPAEYLSLECSKTEKVQAWLSDVKLGLSELGKKIVTCKLWDCSQVLKKLKLCIDIDADQVGGEVEHIMASPEYIEKKNFMDAQRAKEWEQKKMNGLVIGDEPPVFYTVIPFTVSELKILGAEQIGRIYDQYIQLVKDDFREGVSTRMDAFHDRYKKKESISDSIMVVYDVIQKENYSMNVLIDEKVAA